MSLRLQVQEGDCRALRHGERRMPGARVCHCCGPARRVQAHMRAGPMAQVSATCWSSKLSTPRSHRHCSVKQNCTLLYADRSCAQRARSAICVPACMWLRLPTRIPPVHILLASRSTGQRNTTQSRQFSCAMPARMCAMAIALACPHPLRAHAPRSHTQTGPRFRATFFHSGRGRPPGVVSVYVLVPVSVY